MIAIVLVTPVVSAMIDVLLFSIAFQIIQFNLSSPTTEISSFPRYSIVEAKHLADDYGFSVIKVIITNGAVADIRLCHFPSHLNSTTVEIGRMISTHQTIVRGLRSF